MERFYTCRRRAVSAASLTLTFCFLLLVSFISRLFAADLTPSLNSTASMNSQGLAPTNAIIQSLRGKDPEGFKPVFNGKDFSGWAGPTNNYEVKEGAIVCQPGKGGTIYTKEEFTNFVLRLEFKLPPGGNNGLAIRYPGTGDTAYVGMCELQVLDDNYEKATNQRIDPRQAHGSAYGMVAAKRGFQRPIGEWNYQEVTVVGSKIKVELNGTVILDADLSPVKEFMANTAHPGKDRASGHFGFAGHNDPVMFRNVAIKALP